MQLQSVRIANFRCIQEAVFRLESATAFVGGNGSGKSTVLRALDAFYTINPGITPDDYYNRNTSVPIEIKLTFHNFSAAERLLFSSKIEAEHMSVTRVFENGPRNGRYFGSSLLHHAFDGIRELSGMAKRTAYSTFSRENPDYGLPQIRTVAEVDPALEALEVCGRTSANAAAMTANGLASPTTLTESCSGPQTLCSFLRYETLPRSPARGGPPPLAD